MQFLKFWETSKPKPISAEVQEKLRTLFQVGPEQLQSWRMIEKPGRYDRKPMRRVRIIDPAMLNGRKYRRYDDLPKDCVLFEGRISGGDVSLFDHRRRSASTPTS